jgi:hypothetical protein
MKDGAAKGPVIGQERRTRAYRRSPPGLSANGGNVTIIYIGIITAGGNLHAADGHPGDRNTRD